MDGKNFRSGVSLSNRLLEIIMGSGKEEGMKNTRSECGGKKTRDGSLAHNYPATTLIDTSKTDIKLLMCGTTREQEGKPERDTERGNQRSANKDKATFGRSSGHGHPPQPLTHYYREFP